MYANKKKDGANGLVNRTCPKDKQIDRIWEFINVVKHNQMKKL